MQEIDGLVSIIIPAYNAGNFISETITSILQQTYSSWEIILINDGSTDNTADIVASFKSAKITLINQINMGVAASRNNGLRYANGMFVCFFDADDLMTSEFLEARVNALRQYQNIGFVGGLVETFPKETQIRRAVAENPEHEIHFFDNTVVTVPSNYLFRTSVVKENNILFNNLLSSSADRFFLLEIAKYVKGKVLLNKKVKLLYRISEMSMSNHVTPKLVFDYYKFYRELESKNLLPVKKRREIKSRYLFSIASGFLLVKYRKSGFRLLIRSFIIHPLVFFKLLAGKRLGFTSNINKSNNDPAY
jgi:glycosyltransferase involved in cell wall biosynthesis